MSLSAFERFQLKHSMWLFIVLSAIYLINSFGYFRLSHDTIRYLQMEDWMENGIPLKQIASRDFLPYGYSFLLFLLSRLHLLNAVVIIMINIFYLCGSFYFIKKIFGLTTAVFQVMIYVLLSWLIMKSVLTARSEMQYLFFSSGTIWFYIAFGRHREMRWLFAALAFFILALLTRTIAISLLAAAVLDIVLANRKNLSKRILKHKFSLMVALAGLALLIYFFSTLKFGDYIHYAIRPFQSGQGWAFFLLFPGHLSDLGEVFLNTPSSKINFLPVVVKLIIFGLVGLYCFGRIVSAIFLKPIQTPRIVGCYIIMYSVIIFCWPFLDSRFWLPLIPFWISILMSSSSPIGKITSVPISMGKWIYLTTGVFALTYYTFTSFNKQAISVRQDAGIWRNEYETYFFGKPLSDTASRVDPVALKWLKKMN